RQWLDAPPHRLDQRPADRRGRAQVPLAGARAKAGRSSGPRRSRSLAPSAPCVEARAPAAAGIERSHGYSSMGGASIAPPSHWRSSAMEISGKTAIVTGAASGIGLGIATAL